MQATQEQITEGTAEEVAALLQGGAFAGRRMRLYVELSETEDDDEDISVKMPAPSFTVRSQEHLIELLREGIDSPKHEATPETWAQRHRDLEERYDARKS
jgi:hypothetical protein